MNINFNLYLVFIKNIPLIKYAKTYLKIKKNIH